MKDIIIGAIIALFLWGVIAVVYCYNEDLGMFVNFCAILVTIAASERFDNGYLKWEYRNCSREMHRRFGFSTEGFNREMCLRDFGAIGCAILDTSYLLMCFSIIVLALLVMKHSG